MTEGGHGSEPLTPEEDAAVARMLAEAGGPVRMPPEVAARLDDVLADLEKERSTATGADVVELRSRRRWPRVLLAAAAVVVGGYAVGTVATQGTLSGSEDASSAASGSAGDQDASGGGSEASTDSGMLSVPEASGERSRGTVVRRTVRLRSDQLDGGARRALQVLETGRSTSDSAPDRAPHPTQGESDEPGCPAPELDTGERSLLVRYDGAEAVLVAGPEHHGTVAVTIWSCAGDELDSAVVRP